MYHWKLFPKSLEICKPFPLLAVHTYLRRGNKENISQYSMFVNQGKKKVPNRNEVNDIEKKDRIKKQIPKSPLYQSQFF